MRWQVGFALLLLSACASDSGSPSDQASADTAAGPASGSDSGASTDEDGGDDSGLAPRITGISGDMAPATDGFTLTVGVAYVDDQDDVVGGRLAMQTTSPGAASRELDLMVGGGDAWVADGAVWVALPQTDEHARITVRARLTDQAGHRSEWAENTLP